MADDLLSLRMTDHAKFAYSTLGSEDRRLLDAWFDHLRNWRNDEFIRSRSERLPTDEELYLFHTSADLVIAFKVADNEVIVLSILGEAALRKFENARERIAPCTSPSRLGVCEPDTVRVR